MNFSISIDQELDANATTDQRQLTATLLIGLSGIIFFLVLIVLLIVEIFFIYRYKTTFLQRLFFYITIAATIADVASAIQFASGFSYAGSSTNTASNVFNVIALLYAFPVELLLVGAINVTILSKMYQRKQSLQPHTESILCCCLHTKCREAIFISFIFLAPIVTLVMGSLSVTNIGSASFLTLILLPFVIGIWVPAITDLVLSLILMVVMIVWYCKLRKKELMKNNIMKIVCKKTMLIFGFLATFFFIWLLFPASLVLTSFLLIYSRIYSQLLPTVQFAIFSLLQLIIPVFFVGHLCYSRHKTIQVRFKNHNAATVQPTAPPSTRVSLPTDTAAHAPNFLSPSTAGPTDEGDVYYRL